MGFCRRYPRYIAGGGWFQQRILLGRKCTGVWVRFNGGLQAFGGVRHVFLEVGRGWLHVARGLFFELFRGNGESKGGGSENHVLG